MKIVLYENDQVISIYEDITNPRKTENGLEWDMGKFEFSIPFVIVADDVNLNIGDPIIDFIEAEEKQNKIDELSLICEQKISAGFFCEATGYFYRLNSKDQDNFSYRLNTILLTGKENYTKPIYWRTGENGDGVYILHTVDQFITVIDAADDHTTNNTMRYSQLKEKVKACTSISEVRAITWDTPL